MGRVVIGEGCSLESGANQCYQGCDFHPSKGVTKEKTVMWTSSMDGGSNLSHAMRPGSMPSLAWHISYSQSRGEHDPMTGDKYPSTLDSLALRTREPSKSVGRLRMFLAPKRLETGDHALWRVPEDEG